MHPFNDGHVLLEHLISPNSGHLVYDITVNLGWMGLATAFVVGLLIGAVGAVIFSGKKL